MFCGFNGRSLDGHGGSASDPLSRPGVSGLLGAKKRVTGLRLVATDVHWSHGEGPEVSGTGEAILLAATGRPAALGELRGAGLETLSARVAA
jgi:hypothetical protein